MDSPRGNGRLLVLLALWALVGFTQPAAAQDGYWGVVDLGTLENFNDVFFFDADTGWIVGDSGYIRYTTTGGEAQAEWLTPASVPTGENLQKVHFIDALNGFAVGDNGVVLTTVDGGVNWNGADSLGAGLSLGSVFFADLNNGWVTSTTVNDGLYVSSTGAANLAWDPQVTNFARDVFVYPGGDGWVVGAEFGTDYGVIWETSNGGLTWFDFIFSVAYEYYAVGVSSPSNVWVVGESGVMLRGPSPWGGETLLGSDSFLDIAFAQPPDEDVGFVIGAGGVIYRTIDGGDNWAAAPSGEVIQLNGVAVRGFARAWAVGNGGLLIIYRECISDVHCSDGVNGCLDGDACHPVDFTCGAPVGDGTDCDDTFFCTDGDTCQGGICTAGPARDCSGAGDQCNDGICDDVGDACVPDPVVDGTVCDDTFFCTDGDTCEGGSCTGGPARDCSGAGDQCNDGICDDVGDACVPDPVVDGTICDDTLFCTDGDTCQGGACTGGPARDCSGAGDQCNDGICDDVGDACVPDPVVDGTGCDDTFFCTEGDTCQGGICTGGPARDCSGAGDQCNDGICDEIGDACVGDPLVDGTVCDDTLFCTDGDTCQGGICTAGPARDCSGQDDQCNTGVCDEGQGQCVPQPANEGLACDDSTFCTTGETCQGGNCTGGGLTDCSGVADQCNDGVCNVGNDACEPQPVANGTPCDDSVPCTMNDACDVGTCTGPLTDIDGDDHVWDACPGGDDCRDDLFDVHPGVFEGPINDPVCSDGLDNDCNGQTDAEQASCLACGVDADCDDGDVCNGAETCPAGVCVQGAPLDCDDGDDCTANDCDPAAGCQHPALPDETECGVRSCQGLDLYRQTCTAGACVGLDLLWNCADLNPCTTDTCDPVLGCPNPSLPDDTACEDGEFCTDGDTCQAGVCEPGPARDCSVQQACRQGNCDEDNDQCVTTPDADGQVCDDGLTCSLDDTGSCSNGACLGSDPVVCGPGGECFDDVCTEGVGCEQAAWPDGAPCDDLDGCTAGDQCLGGVCVGTGGPDCSSLDEPPCIVGRCNPDTRQCEAVPDLGTACDDANLCTQADACAADGACRGEPVACPDCQACDPASGTCVDDADTQGNGCSSGDGCDGVCDGEGICVVEAWCDRALAGCDQLEAVPSGGEVDCRLEPDTVRLTVAPADGTRPQGGLALLRVELAQGLMRAGDELLVRLRLRPDPNARVALASYVIGSATVQPEDVALEEIPMEEQAEVFFRLVHPEGLPGGLGGGPGWRLELLLEGPSGTDPVVGLDVWAACGADHAIPGCHKDFGPDEREDISRPLAAEGGPLDLQAISESRLIHMMSGRPAEGESIQEFDNLVLGCGCSTRGPRGAIGLGLLVLFIWGLRRRGLA